MQPAPLPLWVVVRSGWPARESMFLERDSWRSSRSSPDAASGTLDADGDTTSRLYPSSAGQTSCVWPAWAKEKRVLTSSSKERAARARSSHSSSAPGRNAAALILAFVLKASSLGGPGDRPHRNLRSFVQHRLLLTREDEIPLTDRSDEDEHDDRQEEERDCGIESIVEDHLVRRGHRAHTGRKLSPLEITLEQVRVGEEAQPRVGGEHLLPRRGERHQHEPEEGNRHHPHVLRLPHLDEDRHPDAERDPSE